MISIGIHIKQDNVCFVGLSLKGTRPNIYFIEELFFESQNSKEERELFVSQHVEKIAERYKGKNLRFCYALPQNFVTSFLVELPFKEKFKILKTLPFEIEDKTPFRPGKVFFDARICGIKDKNKSSVLCFITPEDNVHEFLEFSKQLKKPPYLLSCEGSALANLLEFWNKPLSEVQNPTLHPLYIYLGMQNSQVLLYKNGYLNYVSVLDWSVASIIEEMKKLYKLSKQKAWEEFFNKSFILTEAKGFTKEQVFFSNLIKKQVNLLIPQLNLLKMSLETEKQISIPKTILFGPGSVIKNLTAFLTAEISIPCSRLKTLTDFPDFHLEDKASASVAFGLALEGLKSSPYQGLNFLQSLRKEIFSLFPKKWQKVSLTALLCFFIFTAYTFVRSRESSKILGKIQSVFLDYGTRLAFMEEGQISAEAVQSFLGKEKDKNKSERLIQDELNLPNPMDHLQKIVQKIGPASKWNLSVQYLKVEDGAVEIKGFVNRSSLENFKSRLQNLVKGRFEDHSLKQNSEKPKNNSGEVKSQAPTTPEKESGGNKVKDISLSDKQNPEPPKSLEDTEREERAFFSYSFQLKEEI